MYAEEDRRRLLEARHDIAASQKPPDLSPTTVYQKAIAASRDDLANADAALRAACALAAREHTETDIERTKLGQTIDTLVRRYAFLRGKVQDALVNIDPDIPLPAGEIERRERLLGRVFRIAASDLERMGQGSIIEFVASVVDALETEPDLKALGFGPALSNALNAAKNAAKELNRENDEDAKAMATLRTAREVFDRTSKSHALQIESILVRQSRSEELGRYILAKDAAYAARRAARAPVADEPGAANVENPVSPITSG
jgi:hypothetical protein